MKKNLAKKVTLSILAGAVLMSSSVAWAVEVNVTPSGNELVLYDPYSMSMYVPSTKESKIISSGNTINIQNDGSVDLDKAYAGGLGYSENDGNAKNNTINISGNGSFTNESFGVIGGCTVNDDDIDVVAEGNTVNISGNNSFTKVMGGYAIGNGDAKGNIVNISGGTISTSLSGGYAENGNAEGNTVNISGDVTVGDNSRLFIYGGYGKNANNNKVNISGNVTGTAIIHSGYATEQTGNANNNEVILSGALNLSSVYLYGSGGAGGEGNKLTIDGGNSIVKSVSNFNNINFENVKWEKDNEALLSLDSLNLLQDTTVTVGKVHVTGGTELANGDMMTLIEADSLSGTIANNNDKVTIYKGVAKKVEVEAVVKQSSNNNDEVAPTSDGTSNESIYLEIVGLNSAVEVPEDDEDDNEGTGEDKPASKLNPQVLVIGESRTAATAFTNQGSELIETGLNALARDNEKDTKVFAAVYGNHSEYETGSHVNVNGWSGIVGVGKTNANGLTVGAFFENGEGNYSTHNVTDFGYLRGDGEACYNGGGFLVRKDNANGVYAEAAIRAGKLQNELRDAVIGSTGAMGYDIDTFYYGAQVGIGKIIPRGNDGDSIDVYGKFIYTHHDSEDFTIDGDDFHFDSVDSERLRLGFRINEVQTNKLAMYYGAAWEYEFGGDANNTVVGYDLSTPSLGGSTVIGEIGAHYKASDKWSFDLNGRAYVGQREGFSGSVQANYAF